MLFFTTQNKKRIFFRYFLLAFTVLIFVSPSYAQNLSTLGKVYPIAEQDFLEFIKERLQKLQATGMLATMQARLSKEAQKHIDRPQPAAGLAKATRNRTWIFDPTITAQHDIKDNIGNVVVKAGTKANPLDVVSLSKTLIFYDADDKKQVAWVQKLDKKLQGKVKLILVNGSVFAQVKLWQRAIYFDQDGNLTTHFGIKYVPALVAQTEVVDESGGKVKRLKISEVRI